MKWSEIEVLARRPVVLVADRLDAMGRLCKAGTQISPNVDGWPSHRVCFALQHGTAKVMQEQPDQVELVASVGASVEAEPSLSRKERKKKKYEGAHGL